MERAAGRLVLVICLALAVPLPSLPTVHRQPSVLQHRILLSTRAGIPEDVVSWQREEKEGGETSGEGASQPHHRKQDSASAATGKKMVHAKQGRRAKPTRSTTGKKMVHAKQGRRAKPTRSTVENASPGTNGRCRLVSVDAFGKRENKKHRCRHDGCTKVRYYGVRDKHPLYCQAHARSGDVNVKSERCKALTDAVDGLPADRCRSQATFGKQRGRAVHCSVHKTESDVDVRSARCAFAGGCRTQPSFVSAVSASGERFCASHRHPEAYLPPRRRCRADGCNKAPTFGEPGGGKQYCKEHMLPGQVDVKNKGCRVLGCIKRGVRAAPDREGRLCKGHFDQHEGLRQSGGGRPCLHPIGCTEPAVWGDAENGAAVFCTLHRASWHMDVTGWMEYVGVPFGSAKIDRRDMVSRIYALAGMPNADCGGGPPDGMLDFDGQDVCEAELAADKKRCMTARSGSSAWTCPWLDPRGLAPAPG